MTIDTPTSSSSHSTKIQTEQHTIVVEKEQVDTNATSSSPSSAFQSDPIEPNKNDMKEEIVEEEVVEKPTGLKQKIKGYFGIHLFSGILMVLAGVAIAFQAGKKKKKKNRNHRLLTID
jgi:hypothetical protein